MKFRDGTEVIVETQISGVVYEKLCMYHLVILKNQQTDRYFLHFESVAFTYPCIQEAHKLNSDKCIVLVQT